MMLFLEGVLGLLGCFICGKLLFNLLRFFIRQAIIESIFKLRFETPAESCFKFWLEQVAYSLTEFMKSLKPKKKPPFTFNKYHINEIFNTIKDFVVHDGSCRLNTDFREMYNTSVPVVHFYVLTRNKADIAEIKCRIHEKARDILQANRFPFEPYVWASSSSFLTRFSIYYTCSQEGFEDLKRLVISMREIENLGIIKSAVYGNDPEPEEWQKIFEEADRVKNALRNKTD